MENMGIGEMKTKDLGQMTSKALEELGEEIEEKKLDIEKLAKKKISDLGQKVEKMGE